MQLENFTESEASLERLMGVVERITFHNPETGWTVLKVAPFKDPTRLIPVLIHQAQVFAGATMEFWGSYIHHPKHGEQFRAVRALEKKPATLAALEKYLGSGLIKGVGPAIAKRIVRHFKNETLNIFESQMDQLMNVPGIAEKKLHQIKISWEEHRSIRDVMIFLQGYGISTLFATKIFKTYGKNAIQTVSKNPYQLANDIYGIGFFSADRIALAMGFEKKGASRIQAGIKHVLASSREAGHCFLTQNQIIQSTPELLREELSSDAILASVSFLIASNEIKKRKSVSQAGEEEISYYSKTLYFEELYTAQKIRKHLLLKVEIDSSRVRAWVQRFCKNQSLLLSDEQIAAVCGVAGASFSTLTGGPGCGKTTTTRVLVKLLQAMKKTVLLAAPTGRAAQRMTEVIGIEAKTIHVLIEWNPHQGSFAKNEDNPLPCDFLIVDETSMLDISLASALLKAVPEKTQILFIGDPDQLPAVGAGNVLADLLKSPLVPCFKLTQVFRQAQASSIIRFAHQINYGEVPQIPSPITQKRAFQEGIDCLFLDADEATQEQLHFISRAKQAFETIQNGFLKPNEEMKGDGALFCPEIGNEESVRRPVFLVPEKFKHVNLAELVKTQTGVEELLLVLKKVHPWSTLHWGMTALDTLLKLYTRTIPDWLGEKAEIQVLTPQVRGSLGTLNLNEALQKIKNPESLKKKQIVLGERLFREGDRVIQTRNNYELNVFNGDIGSILSVDPEKMALEVAFSGPKERRIVFEKENLSELSLAYAITIHKSQGSEFEAVIIPVLGQHYTMLFRNLIYTALTRAKKLAIFVGTRAAFSLAVRQIDNRYRQTALTNLIMNPTQT